MDHESDQTINDVEVAFTALQDVTPDGFMMFRPIRSSTGQVVDLEWTYVNAAASAMSGRAPSDLIGKRFLAEVPNKEGEDLFAAYLSVLETGETWQDELHFEHDEINAWFRITAVKGGDGLSVSFADISEVRKADERRKNLIDGLLAFVGMLSLDGILLEANETAVAAAGGDPSDLIGRLFWDCYWWQVDQATKDKLKDAVARAAKGEKIRYDAEIRVVGDQRLWIDFQIVPVMNAAGEVFEMIPSGVDITERKLAEAHSHLLIQELSHRVKNTLATIQSMAGQTMRSAASMDDFRSAFNARLQAISAAHDLLVAFDHRDFPLRVLINEQVMPYAADEARLSLIGQDILLPGEMAHALSLVLHELATNASKYGSFSVADGVVHITWDIVTERDVRWLLITWQERDGPRVAAPTRRGFGTRLIERSLANFEENAVMNYDPDGLSCQLALEFV